MRRGQLRPTARLIDRAKSIQPHSTPTPTHTHCHAAANMHTHTHMQGGRQAYMACIDNCQRAGGGLTALSPAHVRTMWSPTRKRRPQGGVGNGGGGGRKLEKAKLFEKHLPFATFGSSKYDDGTRVFMKFPIVSLANRLSQRFPFICL